MVIFPRAGYYLFTSFIITSKKLPIVLTKCHFSKANYKSAVTMLQRRPIELLFKVGQRMLKGYVAFRTKFT